MACLRVQGLGMDTADCPRLLISHHEGGPGSCQPVVIPGTAAGISSLGHLVTSHQ